MNATTLLSIKQLTKRYAGMSTLALDGVSLDVKAGEVYGFLGANGAGKSTTIRTVLNFIQPTGGSATIAGLDSVRDSVEAKRHVGYLAGEVALYGKVSGKQFLAFMAALQPLKHKAYLQELADRFDVPLKQSIETLSKGNRQKLGIVQAFMHEPDVLILDEPTSGLDPLMQEEFFKLISQTRDRGAAVFLSSHNLSETQRMCDRIGIIKHGKLVREQTMDELTDLGAPVFKIRLNDPKQLEQLKRAAGLRLIAQIDGATITMQPAGSVAAALGALSRFDIKTLTTEQLDLEDEFLKFYGDDK